RLWPHIAQDLTVQAAKLEDGHRQNRHHDEKPPEAVDRWSQCSKAQRERGPESNGHCRQVHSNRYQSLVRPWQLAQPLDQPTYLVIQALPPEIATKANPQVREVMRSGP